VPPPTWELYKLTVPGKDIFEKVREVLETLLTYLEILKAILETIKKFLVDFGNPIRALVEALIQLIKQIIEALRQTGLYGYFDIPHPELDANLTFHRGGFPNFVTRLKGSLYDSKDPNRPQPVPWFNRGGMLILMLDAETPAQLLALIRMLLRFFGKEGQLPRYEAPANFKVLPIGNGGDPILDVAALFTDSIEACVLEWSLPTTQDVADPGFVDMVSKVASEFLPPKFLIEKTEISPNIEIEEADLQDPDKVGLVMVDQQSNYEQIGEPGKYLTRRLKLRDTFGEPTIKFRHYYVIDSDDASFWLGQLGTYRWIDDEVEFGHQYFYRVRAFSGELSIDEVKHEIAFQPPVAYWPYVRKVFWYPSPQSTRWPMGDLIVGKSTEIKSIRIPDEPLVDFDVLENLKWLFQMAISLDFHREAPTNENGKITSTFDKDGFPTGTTANSEVGRGSIAAQAAFLGLQFGVFQLDEMQTESPITGSLPDFPWQKFPVRRTAARLALLIGPAMQQAGALLQFRDIMLGAFPRGPFDVGGVTEGKINMSQVFEAMLPQRPIDPTDPDPTIPANATTYQTAYGNTVFRLNVLYIIQWIKSFTLGGAPEDWRSLALLRDIIPWSGAILYAILDIIDALLKAFQGVIEEIKAFIDLLIRKIESLEQFIAFLISILDVIESLEIGFFLLNVGETTTGVEGWIQAIDAADTVDLPTSGPSHYSAGVALAYVAFDTDAVREAFDLIF